MYGQQNQITGAMLGADVREAPAIAQAIDRLDKAISQLDEVLSTLSGRLIAVRHERPGVLKESNPSSPGSSPFCYAVVGHAARVEALRDHALRMLEELEI